MPSQKDLPLAGVRLIDLTSFLSGPFATQILADLGADVIKIERPPKGDLSRSVPPHFVAGESLYFLSTNRNKRSICLDLNLRADFERLLKLIETADVVMDNFRPKVLDKLGLDPAAIIQAQPKLVWASITGFGQNGPYRDKPAYDMIVQAMAGVMSVTGEPGGQPLRLGIPAGDTVAGLYALVGLLAVLADVRQGGPGRWVDISMLDVQRAMLSYQATYSLNTDKPIGPQGAGHDYIATYRSFKGSDGVYFVVTANTQDMWQRMCATIGRADLVADARFADMSQRLANKFQLWPELEAAFSNKTAAQWVNLLEANDVPCALINDTVQALNDIDVAARGIISEVASSEGGAYKAVLTPIRFVGSQAPQSRFPPHLGEHQHDVDLQ